MRSEGEVHWNRMRLRYYAAGVAILLAGTSVWMISAEPTPGKAGLAEDGSQSGKAFPTVVVVEPDKRDVTQKVLLPGSLEPYQTASLHAKVTGYLEEIRVDIGDSVREGEVLARLSIPEMKSELQRAEAEVPAAIARLHEARAEAELARLTHGRLADLRSAEPGAVTHQDVDIAAATEKVRAAGVKLARAEVRSAEAHVAELKTLGTYAMIRAPFDGLVVARFADIGALISGGGNGGEPIVKVVQSDKLRLVIEMPESLALYCRSGLKLDFKLDALPGQSFSAEVSRFAGVLNRETRSMRVEADVENTGGRFHPGMYARVSVNLAGMSGVSVLPSTALRGGGALPYVYAVQNGAVQRIDLTILKDNGAEVVVEGDIEDRTQVIIAGPPLLEVGQRVHIRNHEGP